MPDVPFTKSIFSWCMVVAAGYIISLPVHELIHAAFFKLLGPRGTQIKFGFKQGLLYTTCPGTHIERARFMVILMAPFVILSAVYLVFGLVSHEYSATLALFLLHASGCAGDMYFTWCILRNPQANMVEDTSVGITLWQE